MSLYMLTSPIAGDRAAYVGVTKHAEVRYHNHLTQRGPDRIWLWISALKSMGKLPIMTILDECLASEASVAEEDCIAIVRATRGEDLLNHIHYHPYPI
jgi:hypothetical protein